MRRVVIQITSDREGGNIYQRWESEPMEVEMTKRDFRKLVKVAERLLKREGKTL